MSLRLAARLQSSLPSLTRAVANKAAQRPVPPPRGMPALLTLVPSPSTLTRTNAATLGNITSPQDFLKAIGRSAENKLSPESWEQLWHTDGFQLKKAGLGVSERRCVSTYAAAASLCVYQYLMLAMHGGSWAVLCGLRYSLWSMEKFRQGLDPAEFAHEAKPEKKIRGYVHTPVLQDTRLTL